MLYYYYNIVVFVVVVFFLLLSVAIFEPKRLKSGHLRLRSIQDYVNLCYNIVSRDFIDLNKVYGDAVNNFIIYI